MQPQTSLEMKRFVEQQRELNDDLEYVRDKREPGLILIFNQQNFTDESLERRGSDRDVQELIVSFGRIGYNIEEHNIFNNSTRKDIMSKLNEGKEIYLTISNCFASWADFPIWCLQKHRSF